MNTISNYFFKLSRVLYCLSSSMVMRGVLIGAIMLLVTQISLFGVYCMQSRSMEPTLSIGNIIGVNRTAYGLKVPFFHANLVQWKLPQVNDIVMIETKSGHKLIKSVTGIPRDVVTIEHRRYVVPNGYVLVTDTATLTTNKRNFVLVPIKKVLGRLAFIVR